MAMAAATVVPLGLRRPTRTVWNGVRQMLANANHVSTPAWGVPLTELASWVPSIVRGGVRQSLACYARPASFAHRGGPAVLLVPGMFCQPSVFNPLGRELERLGCDVYLPRSFPYFHGIFANTAPVARSLAILLNDLERLTVKEGVDEITLVGHSLGGLLCLAAAEKADNSPRALPRIRAVVLLATPLQGSPLAASLGCVVPACHDVTTGSLVLRELQAGIAATPCRIVSSGRDSIVPLRSQEALNVEVTRLDDFQHTDFYAGTGDRVARAARAIADAVRSSSAPRSRRSLGDPAAL